MQKHKIADFATIEAEFLARAHDAVWCAAATINPRDHRPRTRVLHPIWEGRTGWIGTNRHSSKEKHLAANPALSLAYVKDPFKPVYVDCEAVWEDDMAEKRRIWEWFNRVPAPLGYDPGLIWGTVENPEFGLLKLIPWRVELYHLAVETKIWQQA